MFKRPDIVPCKTPEVSWANRFAKKKPSLLGSRTSRKTAVRKILQKETSQSDATAQKAKTKFRLATIKAPKLANLKKQKIQ